MPILGVIASSVSGNLWPANSYESIASFAPTSGTSVSFTSIPQTYSSLQIRMIGFASSSNGFSMTLNGSSTGYTRHATVGSNTTVAAFGNASRTYVQLSSGSANPSTTYGTVILSEILNYASSTKNKVVRAFTGLDTNNPSEIGLWSSVWVNTSAITSIEINSVNGAFTSGTSIALYGIKG